MVALPPAEETISKEVSYVSMCTTILNLIDVLRKYFHRVERTTGNKCYMKIRRSKIHYFQSMIFAIKDMSSR